MEYEKLSGEYHKIANSQQYLKDYINLLEEKMSNLRTDIDMMEYKRKELLGIRYLEELKDISYKIAKFEAEMEKENLKQADKRVIILDLEYSLRQKYQDRLEQYEEKLESRPFC